MRTEVSIVSDVSVVATGLVILVGLTALGIRLQHIQLRGAAQYAYDGSRQAVRRVQTAGARGLIVDRRGRVLAENRIVSSLAVNPERFQRRTETETEKAIVEALATASKVLECELSVPAQHIRRHLRQVRSLPLIVRRNVDDTVVARFAEHERELAGFTCIEELERHYPFGSLAAQVLGYVGRNLTEGDGGDERFSFREQEMRGRSGLESYYDTYLRGVSGETRLVVDALGYTSEEEVLSAPQKGPDLELTLDCDLQRVVEAQLVGERGAAVVLDPRSGDVLAMASSPTFDPNDCVPTVSSNLYARLTRGKDKPMLNRACAERYAPGSVFKPVTALAGLRAGRLPEEVYECIGAYGMAGSRIRCARRWGHGDLDVRHALRESCNPFFCSWGVGIGMEALAAAARDLGLGAKTGLDFPDDKAGFVPSAAELAHEEWSTGNIALIAIGQGKIDVTPLQMARMTAAVGTGWLVTPRLWAGASIERKRLPFSERDLAVVREGMRMVVDGGTGKLAGEGLAVAVSGKTGTAEVDRVAGRTKNTWFVAYAPSENPTVAVALMIENGESGGGTAAPRVRNILKEVFGEK